VPVAKRVQLRAGQRGRLGPDGAVAVLPVDSAAFSWLTGALAFTDVPAQEAVAVIGRWYGVQIAVAPALAERRLTARFVSQPLPQLLDALALSLGATVDRRGMQITLTP
jgi:transmembrane sensor